LGVFRAQVWAEGLTTGETLHRVSYRVLPDYVLTDPVVLTYARLVAVSGLGQKLHEALLPLGGQIRQKEILLLGDDLLVGLLNEKGEFPAIPAKVGTQLRSLFPFHERALLALLAERQKSETAQLKTLLDAQIKNETGGVRGLMRERIREIEQRLVLLKQQPDSPQLALFELDEYAQYQEDVAWLERKLSHLRERLEVEPERIKQRYSLRSVRIFPLGLLYLLPQSLIR
jgi:hypothetical protein